MTKPKTIGDIPLSDPMFQAKMHGWAYALLFELTTCTRKGQFAAVKKKAREWIKREKEYDEMLLSRYRK